MVEELADLFEDAHPVRPEMVNKFAHRLAPFLACRKPEQQTMITLLFP
ncbi:MAG: hypothetical protein BWY82_02950 [Verrucomicrobia bacterium ADurb.Bin474]|nr:MAG: hypothetical protein BWY82_02950 [Verrucomicrobia bacterium ADurb.Bin474]